MAKTGPPAGERRKGHGTGIAETTGEAVGKTGSPPRHPQASPCALTAHCSSFRVPASCAGTANATRVVTVISQHLKNQARPTILGRLAGGGPGHPPKHTHACAAHRNRANRASSVACRPADGSASLPHSPVRRTSFHRVRQRGFPCIVQANDEDGVLASGGDLFPPEARDAGHASRKVGDVTCRLRCVRALFLPPPPLSPPPPLRV